MQGLIKDLRRIVEPKRLLTELEDRMAYAYDGTFRTRVPDLVVRPVTTAEVSGVLRLANREGLPVVPRGGATSLSGGAVPLQGGIVLALTSMNRILSFNREDLLVMVEPGVVTAHLHRNVEGAGLFYPPDPQSLEASTLGGNIAENAGGPRGIKYGVTRDYILGLEVVLPDGEIIQVGGSTVKNVSGYDLTRLFTGSEGTLGVITRANLKLIPKPEARRRLLAVYDDLGAAGKTVTRIIDSGVIPSMLEIMDDTTIQVVESYGHFGLPVEAAAILILEVDGFAETVERQASIIADLCRSAGAIRLEVARNEKEGEDLLKARRAVSPAVLRIDPRKPTKISEDATVPRSKVPEMIVRLKEIARRHDVTMVVYGHAGDGNLHPNIITNQDDPEEMARAEAAIDEVFKLALELGGTLSGEHGIGYLKAPYLVNEFGPAGVKAMRAIKEALDPKGIMNPGKIFDQGIGKMRAPGRG